MVDNDYPVPSHLSDVFSKSTGWIETPRLSVFYLELTRFDLFLFLSQSYVKDICPDYEKPSPPSDDGSVIRLRPLRSPPPANCFGHRGISMLATQPTQYQIYIQELQPKPAPVHQERMSVQGG